MTKQEAKDFLARNPRIMQELRGKSPDNFKNMETLYWFGLAETEEDAQINIIAVINALMKKESGG